MDNTTIGIAVAAGVSLLTSAWTWAKHRSHAQNMFWDIKGLEGSLMHAFDVLDELAAKQRTVKAAAKSTPKKAAAKKAAKKVAPRKR